ncbi:DUF6894 family protein [Bradyrhizobium rifense]|uniref:DUF6894 family protein n=1 Tax=Bradyrhizobium rifense TaxID=515499 RepID=UPI001FE55728|nr:hypothetical protein [Bradyrhizobium rifense]
MMKGSINHAPTKHVADHVQLENVDVESSNVLVSNRFQLRSSVRPSRAHAVRNEMLRFCVSARDFKEMDVPRYHFNLVDSKTVADEGGADLPDDIVALDVAEEIARRLLAERPQLRNRHFSILVTNQEGEEIGKVPLDVLH